MSHRICPAALETLSPPPCPQALATTTVPATEMLLNRQAIIEVMGDTRLTAATDVSPERPISATISMLMNMMDMLSRMMGTSILVISRGEKTESGRCRAYSVAAFCLTAVPMAVCLPGQAGSFGLPVKSLVRIAQAGDIVNRAYVHFTEL